MVHDLDEVRVGDVNSLTADDEAMQLKESNEELSRDYLREYLKDSSYLLELLERYWAQNEPIVQYARSFEKFDPSFVHQRDGGEAIRGMGINTPQEYRKLDDRAIERMAEYAPQDILEIRRLLGVQVMKAVFNTV
jgi:5'-deoxynucleotidase YfbR-like HD superfamily hydrolase